VILLCNFSQNSLFFEEISSIFYDFFGNLFWKKAIMVPAWRSMIFILLFHVLQFLVYTNNDLFPFANVF